MTQAFPLQWPAGWPRTKFGSVEDARYRFKRPNGLWTFADARDELMNEAGRLGSPDWNTVISSNFPLKRNGEPTAAGARPKDQGVAIYLRRGNKPYVMACDSFVRAEENMRSLALAIAAMRQLERHGGGVMMERAFEGFSALPAPGSIAWWQILQVSEAASRAEIDASYRRLARERHPDVRGGSEAMMADLNAARDAALRGRP